MKMLCTSPGPASPAGSEISVGAPSPPLNGHNGGDDYFRPLKRLKMVEEQRPITPPPPKQSVDGVKSFSIADILGHEAQERRERERERESENGLPPKIIRPWDHLRGPVPVRPFLPPALLHYEHRLALDYHQQLQEHFRAQAQLLRHMSMEIIPSESGSERSSSAASDCCSPEIGRTSEHSHHQQQQQHNNSGSSGPKSANGTPLDALFQMTNKNFDEAQSENGE
jgi:hypothetical protein